MRRTSASPWHTEKRRSSGMTLEPHERHVLRRHRVPVGTSNPYKRGWIVSIDEESFPVTEQEASQIASYTLYVIGRLYPYFAEKLARDDYPAVAGHDTLVLRKGNREAHHNTTWYHHKLSWRDGLYLPSDRPEVAQKVSLIETLDRVSEINPKPWKAWKREHPEIFQLH